MVGTAGGLELLLAVGYIRQGAAYHDLVHLFSGGAAALTFSTVVLLLRRRPAHPGQLALLVVVTGHLLAAVPDLLFALGEPHRPWMNVFVAHLAAHNAPGGTWGLLGLFLAALAAYLLATEDDAGHRTTAAGPGRRAASGRSCAPSS